MARTTRPGSIGNIDRLAAVAECCRLTLLAWTCLPNYAHSLLRTGPRPLERLICRLLTGYATAFHRRHRRHGHLFQNRYREHTDDIAGFETVITLWVIDSPGKYWKVRRHQVRRLIREAHEQGYGRRAG